MNKKNRNSPAVKQKHSVRQSRSPEHNNSVQVTHAQYSGPIPLPDHLEQYDKIVTGAAERILAMAEADAEHQRAMERDALAAQKREVFGGQWFAFGVTLCAFGTAIVFGAMGYPTQAAAFAGTTVVSLAVAFITGRRSPK